MDAHRLCLATQVRVDRPLEQLQKSSRAMLVELTRQTITRRFLATRLPPHTALKGVKVQQPVEQGGVPTASLLGLPWDLTRGHRGHSGHIVGGLVLPAEELDRCT
jgi:hypothetical protein